MKKFNVSMALQWFIYLPLLLPLCIVFGAIEGALSMIQKLIKRIYLDVEL